MSYSIPTPQGQQSFRHVPTRNSWGRRRIGFGSAASERFVPANPFAVPLQRTQASGVSMAAVSCGPGMTPDPILGVCLPDGSDPTRCPPGMTYKVGTGCIFIPQSAGCPPGTQSDPAGISCWPTNIPGTQPTQPTSGGGCPAGYAKDPILGTACIPTAWPVPGSVPGQGLPTAAGCLLGMVKDAAGNCVFPFCLPGQTFNMSTGSCEPTSGGSAGGYDIVKQACDLLPAALRPPGCAGPGAGTPSGTSSTGGANLSLLCDLIPAGFPSLPGCPTKADGTKPDTIPPKTIGVSVTDTEGLGFGSALLALAGVGVVGAGIYFVSKKMKKGRR